jgi:hypothetical protein
VQLQARPLRPFSSAHRVRSGCGDIATLKLHHPRQGGDLEVAHDRYRVRPGSGGFVLESAEGVLATASKPGVRRWFEITYADRRLTIEPGSALGRVYVVSEGVADRGAVRRRRAPFTRGLETDLAPEVPLAIQLFIAWLMLGANRLA